MRLTLVVAGVLWLGGLAAAQEVDRAAVSTAVRAAVRGYEGLLKELDLGRLPTTLPGYGAVTDQLDELGATLEAVTRLAGQPQLTEEQWRHLQERTAALTAALQVLRGQSLPLRVWAFWDAQGHGNPQWGLAVDYTLRPLPQPKGQADAEAKGEAVLKATPGGTCHAQIVLVPLGKDLHSILVTRKGLAGAAGTIGAGQLDCAPVNYARLPQEPPAAGEQWWRSRLLLTRPDVAGDLTQAFILTVAVPPDQKPGRYQGPLYFSPANARALALQVVVEVTTPAPAAP